LPLDLSTDPLPFGSVERLAGLDSCDLAAGKRQHDPGLSPRKRKEELAVVAVVLTLTWAEALAQKESEVV
jgi:hypothetical protein